LALISRSAQRSQGSGQQRSERGGRPQSPSQPRQGQRQGQSQGQRRDHGNRQGFRSANALPSEKRQQSVQQQQLEYHRKQMAEERVVAAPANEQGREKGVSALFGWIGRKVA